MRIGRGEDDAPARARADHREQTPFIGQAPAVDLGASDDAVERAEIEHRLGPGQAREVALERVEDDHGVELATGGRVRGQHVDLVVVGLGAGGEARRPLGRIERQQEGSVDGSAVAPAAATAFESSTTASRSTSA